MSNKDLIERMRSDSYSLPSDGEWMERNGDMIPKNSLAMGADALEAADKRIAELEALLDERHEDYRRERDRLNEENSAVLECLNEAERKLDVAREALQLNIDDPFTKSAMDSAREALAQIGGEEDTSAHDEAEYYAELNRGYAKDRM